MPLPNKTELSLAPNNLTMKNLMEKQRDSIQGSGKAYSSTTTYEKYDTSIYDDIEYISIYSDGNTQHTNQQPDVSPTYWQDKRVFDKLSESYYTKEETQKNLTADITVTVGSTGDYTTINEALEYLTKTYSSTYKSNGIKAEVQLQDGYVIEEQLLFDGVDLSWVTLSSLNTSVDYPSGKHLVNRSALTTEFTDTDYGLTSYPVFGAKNGASSPVLSFVLDGQVTLGSGISDDRKMGIVVAGAKVTCKKTAGAVKMSGYACYCWSGGTITAYKIINSCNSTTACFNRAGTITAFQITNSSDSGYACYALAGTITAFQITNSSDSNITCFSRAGTISAEILTNLNSASSTTFLTQVQGGGMIKSYNGTWSDNGTGGKANQAAGIITANGYINRIG